MNKKESTPQISVIMSVYNRRYLLPRALQSIKNQTSKNFELIIVDNGSTDGTRDVIESWTPRLKEGGINTIVCDEPRRGISKARNTGLREVNGRYVMFFDSDDEMLPAHIETVSKELELHTDLDLVWFDIKFQDEEGWSKVKSVNDSNPFRGHLLHSSLGSARFAVRKELLCESGGFDESLAVWEDVELGVRLLCKSRNFKKLNCEPQVIVYPQTDSVTGRPISANSESMERALDLCEETLRRHGKEEHSVWVDVKRMVLSGLYARSGEKILSEKLSDKVLNKTSSGRNRIVLGFTRDTVAYFGRGGCAIAKALIRRDKGSKNSD